MKAAPLAQNDPVLWVMDYSGIPLLGKPDDPYEKLLLIVKTGN
jgi:hypothetical protein